jgi:hypothetical protein
MSFPQANKEHVSSPSTTPGAADRRLNKEPKEAPGHKGTTEAVNTKNWYRRETDLWAEFGRRVLTVYFGAPSMFITLWFGFDYGTNPPLGTLII